MKIIKKSLLIITKVLLLSSIVFGLFMLERVSNYFNPYLIYNILSIPTLLLLIKYKENLIKDFCIISLLIKPCLDIPWYILRYFDRAYNLHLKIYNGKFGDTFFYYLVLTINAIILIQRYIKNKKSS